MLIPGSKTIKDMPPHADALSGNRKLQPDIIEFFSEAKIDKAHAPLPVKDDNRPDKKPAEDKRQTARRSIPITLPTALLKMRMHNP